MLSWVLQITIVSIIFILLVHHLFHFFKDTLTVPKVKDLVNIPTQKYEDIHNILNNSANNNENTTQISDIPIQLNISKDNLLPKPQINKPNHNNDMKNELKNFMKKQLNSDDESSHPAYMPL